VYEKLAGFLLLAALFMLLPKVNGGRKMKAFLSLVHSPIPGHHSLDARLAGSAKGNLFPAQRERVKVDFKVR